jgi:hypothetical protein
MRDPLALDGAVRAEELKAAYLAVMPDFTAGKIGTDKLTDVQIAGLWICQHGTAEAALAAFRTAPFRKKYLAMWPRFKSILEEAWRSR